MNIPVYVTGNTYKAKLFNSMVGLDLPHQSVDIEELQSLDLQKIITHKVIGAYKILKKPVIVEDTRLTFNALGKLPGPLIKWFFEELGADGLCQMLTNFSDRSAVAGSAIAYFDGKHLEIFESSLEGKIADSPRGDSGFGWNVIFIPKGSTKTFGEMAQKEFNKYYKQVKPFDQISKFIKNLDLS